MDLASSRAAVVAVGPGHAQILAAMEAARSGRHQPPPPGAGARRCGGGAASQAGAEAAVPATRRRLPSQAGAARPSVRHVYGCMLREASWGRVQPP